MSFSKWLLLSSILLLFPSFVWADTASCSADSFRNACNSCQFDANGKMNEACWKDYQEKGKACIAKEYPITAGMYSQGNCPEIDQCANKLKACIAAAPTLSDKEDCSNTEVKDCYWYADQCVKEAEYKCNPLDIDRSVCSPAVVLLSLVVFGGMLTSSRSVV
jgi:hypothetical protein